MQRSRHLRNLSSDHHQALALALKARRLGAGATAADAQALWQEISERFERELEPHFRIEEQLIGKPLADLGEHALAQRLLSEHQQLRNLLASHEEDPHGTASRFGSLLQEHVRFEERELFPAAEARLGTAELLALERAHESATGPGNL